LPLKPELTKPLPTNLFSTHNPDGEVLYGIDVLLIHNIAAYD
jgi:hypothetical protein